MFDETPEQFHQFIAPRTTLPLHLSTQLHVSSTPNNFLPFDPNYNPFHHQLPLQPNLLHPLQPHSPTDKHKENEPNCTLSSINTEIERDQRQLPELIDSWTNDEVLALLRIRSSMESWFPELTWEHVSRKLAELGFKKSAEKCKEKFEHESRYFININNGKNFRFLSELEEIYQGDQNTDPTGKGVVTEKTQQLEKPMGHAMEENYSRDVDAPATKQHCDGIDKFVEKSKDRKRKRRSDRFEMFKGFCHGVVNKMMAQQEDIHNKLLEDMLKRDEEKFAREESWKKQEMDRMNKELEIMAQEQAIAGDRQATIIEFLKKYENGSNYSSSPLHSQNPNTSTEQNNFEPTPSNTENPSSSDTLVQVPSSSNSSPAPHNPSSSLNSLNNPLESNSVSKYKVPSTPLSTTEKEYVGRRWPRDEVLALINLRCTSLNNNNEDKEGNNKAPLWERISQGMSELGYKRSSKRCKEKWENINKYFRKTKDVNKKRSLDSRTCPYFHQLNFLYSQGKLVPQSEMQGNHLNPTTNSGKVPSDQAQVESSQAGSSGLI
ncbi:trihelix transcription factor GTL2-like [Gastrolobium bilobum]|uniref:trihelix transcription factor GTL2-like n=1 Tax=Gastrolobium bilobum TaxID=150636 RepID=UPI002AAF78B1|nr:trihelix transcription factor GTL2-like [Gastrolobium bilobum]